MLFFIRGSCFDFSLNVLSFASPPFGPPLREQSTHSKVFFRRDTISDCLGQRLLRRRSFFNVSSWLAMQVIEESIDVKSMQPSLLAPESVHTMVICIAFDNRRAMP